MWDAKEAVMYDTFVKKGIMCHVHDPDFVAPLDAMLRYELPHGIGQRHMLRLECEDDQLSFTKPVRAIFAAPDSGMYRGFGVALREQPCQEEVLRILIFETEEEHSCILRVLARLQDDPRAYRKQMSSFGCMPLCGATVAARRRNRRNTAMGRLGSLDDPRSDARTTLARRPAKSQDSMMDESGTLQGGADMAHRLTTPDSGLHRTISKDGGPPELELVGIREFCRKEYDACRKHAETLLLPGIRKVSLSGSISEKFKQGAAVKKHQSSTSMLGSLEADANHSSILLLRLAGQTGAPAPELFGYPICSFVQFEAFWQVCREFMFLDVLWSETSPNGVLNGRFQVDPHGSVEGPVMTLEKWRWFLVQVQEEDRAVVEAAKTLLDSMSFPEVDKNKSLTLYGLSRYLCSPANSIVSPGRCDGAQDLTKPLSEYWIASSLPIYSEDGLQDGKGDATPSARRPGSILDGFHAALESQCRCWSLALVAMDDEPSVSDVAVLLRNRSAPLHKVLQFICEHAFTKPNGDLPLILVLSLERLHPLVCSRVPDILRKGLGDRLWTRSSDKDDSLPSPDLARGHVIVMLEPLRLRFTVPGEEKHVMDAEDEDYNYRVWKELSAKFAVWAGGLLDPLDMDDALDEVDGEEAIGFDVLASEELLALEDADAKRLASRSQRRMLLVQSAMSRRAPVGFELTRAWALGAQLVPTLVGLDTGRSDASALAHSGRFLEAGGCGYVLKPPSLRGPASSKVSSSASSGGKASTASHSLRLELRVLGARAVPGGGKDERPLVSQASLAVSVWGARGDGARASYKVGVPVGAVITWSESRSGPQSSSEPPPKRLSRSSSMVSMTDIPATRLLAFTISSPATAILVFEILELDTVGGGLYRVAGFAAPVDALRGGLRWVPLWDTKQDGGSRARPTQYGAISGCLVHLSLRS